MFIFSFPFIFIEIKVENVELNNIYSFIGNVLDNKINILILIGYAIISFFFNILTLQIINQFSPNHFTMGRILESFGLFLANVIIKNSVAHDYLIIRIIMYILLVFASFIFNEYLIINICGLAKNTKVFLDYEAESEIFYDINNNYEVDEGENNSHSDNNSSLLSMIQ